jgi:hypothetical protein
LQFKASLGKQFKRPYLKKTLHKKGMEKWFKVKALSSNPSTTERGGVGEARQKKTNNKKTGPSVTAPLCSSSHF